MQKRYKTILIMILSLILTFMALNLTLGRIQNTEIVVVKKNGIDVSKPLKEQLDFLTTRTILSSELSSMNGSVVTKKEFDSGDFKNRHLIYALGAGSPLIKSAVSDDTTVVGSFAQSMPIKSTTITLADAASQLPQGVVPGDRIDIGLTVDKGNGQVITGMLMRDIPIYSIDAKNNTVTLKVTQQQHLELRNAQGIGPFILQLPGRKEVKLCTPDELQQRSTGSVECYAESDDAKPVSRDEIINQVINNNANYGDFMGTNLNVPSDTKTSATSSTTTTKK